MRSELEMLEDDLSDLEAIYGASDSFVRDLKAQIVMVDGFLKADWIQHPMPSAPVNQSTRAQQTNWLGTAPPIQETGAKAGWFRSFCQRAWPATGR